MSDSNKEENKDVLNDLSDLESQLPIHAFKALDDAEEDIFGAPVRFAAIYTPINDVLMTASLFKTNQIRCKVMSNGEFGTIAFLEDTLKDSVDEAAHKMTRFAPNFEICVFRYSHDKLKAELWKNGKLSEKILPPVATANLSEKGELALLSKIDFFDPRWNEDFDVKEITAPEYVPSICLTKAMRAKAPDVPIVDKDEVFIFDSALIDDRDLTAIQLNFFRKLGR